MAPGNAWHFPANAETPANYDSMRSPIFPVDPKTPKTISSPVTIFIGNQWAGSDTAGNLLSADSFLNWRTTDNPWTSVILAFDKPVGNNKYFRAEIPVANLTLGAQIQYYFTLVYSDREPTFLGVAEDDPTGRASARFLNEDMALARPFTFTIGTQIEQKSFAPSIDKRTDRGEWSNVFPLPNVAAHAHLLRTGKILMWGRRGALDESMNTLVPKDSTAKPATCAPVLLEIQKPDKDGKRSAKLTTIKPPFLPDGSKLNVLLPSTISGKISAAIPKTSDGKTNANLFCSGHVFLPNGNLFVAGGHLEDGNGLDQSCIYEIIPKPADGVSQFSSPATVGVSIHKRLLNTLQKGPEGIWKAVSAQKDGTIMGNGRWYPTVTALATGVPLVVSGSYQQGASQPKNIDTQVLRDDEFKSIVKTLPTKVMFDLYPRMHVASSGIVYWISLAAIWFLDMETAGDVQWQEIPVPKDQEKLPDRSQRDYACSVMYDKDQIIYTGGGRAPTATTELLDLSNRQNIAWKPAPKNMIFPRRQHNATILPDGTVLVTGGTRGNGDFNDLRPGQPVHMAELWNPKTKEWTMMASEQVDRCYHSTAVLLPDGRVLSAGGGEFQNGTEPNDDKDSHRDAQIFSPPYLFLDGPRPKIDSISTEVIVCDKDSTFTLVTANPDQVDKINLIGMSSVTHSNNTGQRLVPLDFDRNSRPLKVLAPPNAKSCPPGYYMLFIVNKKGQPSEANIVQLVPTAQKIASHRIATAQLAVSKPPTVLEMRTAVRKAAKGTRVELGITGTCPYGLSACWGGAFEALSNLSGVEQVDPMPHASGSTASVFLENNGLPDLSLWTRQFKGYVRESYGLRGYEAAVTGSVEVRDNALVLLGEGMRPEVSLVCLGSEAKIQWDPSTRGPQTLTEEEAAAYDGLFQSASSGSIGPVTITGPLSQRDAFRYTLQVRLVKWESSVTA